LRARRARHERAGKLAEVQAELARGQSQQALARQLQVPRATLRVFLAWVLVGVGLFIASRLLLGELSG